MNEGKEHLNFKRIIMYCKLMNYDLNDIKNMSDFEMGLWYKKTLQLIQNETDFRINTGMVLDAKEK